MPAEGRGLGSRSASLKRWSNYFRIGTVSKAYRKVDGHVCHRVRQWLCVKFKVRGHGRRRFPDQHLYQKLGLYQLQRTSRRLFVGERVKQNMSTALSESPVRENRTPGLMSGV